MTLLKDRLKAAAPVRARRRVSPLLVVLIGAVVVVALTYLLPPFRTYQLATIGAYFCVTEIGRAHV